MKNQIVIFLLFLAFQGFSQNYSLNFDGSSCSVSLPDFEEYENATVEMWIRPNVTSAVNTFMGNGPIGNLSFALSVDTDNSLNLSINDADWSEVSSDPGTISTSHWNHIAISWDGEKAYMYINGAFQKELISNEPLSISSAWYLGASTISGSLTYYRGSIDEFRFWNTTRTVDEIQDNMNLFLSGSETGLVAYYKMDDGTGSTLTDSQSAGSNNGTISGTPIWPLLPFSGGYGTDLNPWIIASIDDLVTLVNGAEYLDEYFLQTADIDATETSSWNSGFGWMPIAMNATFSGSYNGNNHKISNLFMNWPTGTNIGMFYTIGNDGLVENLEIIDINISGSLIVGGIVGRIENGTVKNCSISGQVVGGETVGVVGLFSGGFIDNCHSLCTISGNNNIGGLCGKIEDISTVNACSFSGSVIGNSKCGGIVGLYIGVDVSISNSLNEGDLNCTGDYVGGIAGYNYGGTITKSFSTGTVISSGNNVGGLVGYNYFHSKIENCYSKSPVTGNNYVGGLVGQNYICDITNCYSMGAVSGNTYDGGLIGDDFFGTIAASFWDKETSTYLISDAGTGMTTSEMKTQSTFTDAGWDFVDEITNGTNDIWDIETDINDGYPFFTWQVFDDPGSTIPNKLLVESSLEPFGDECFDAYTTITVAGEGLSVLIPATAEAAFIAGQSIRFLLGFHAEAGSYVDAHITTSGEYCNFAPLAPIVQAEPVVEKSIAFDNYGDVEQEPFAEKQIKLYPNPNNGRFTLQLSNFDNCAQVMVVNLLGKVMHQATDSESGHFEIDMLNAPRGVYTVVVSDNEAVKTSKMVVY